MKLNKTFILTTLISAAGLLGAQKAAADSYHFDISTGVLTDTSPNPYVLDLALFSGGSFTNTITLSNFVFTGGGPITSPGLMGSASGDLGNSVILSSGTNFINDFSQAFSNGTSEIQFDLETTTIAGGTPDTFAVSILDLGGTPLNTTDPNGSLADLEIHTNTLADPILTSTFSSIDPSPVGVTANVVPEPVSGVAAVCGIGMLLGVRRRRAV